MGSTRLRGELIPVHEIDDVFLDQLYALHNTHYDNSRFNQFATDFREKQWVIVLRDEQTGAPAGFSTQMLLEVTVNGHPVRALFSGDTIIHRDFWGTQELVRTWCRFAAGLKMRCPEVPLYWFLISKGYRTYLYLPLFFRRFYPRRDHTTPPFEQALIHTLGATKFPGEYDPATGRVEHGGLYDRVRPDLDATARRQHNPDVDFFVRVNPRYAEGAELVCIAEISRDNMRGGARRELETEMRRSVRPGA